MTSQTKSLFRWLLPKRIQNHCILGGPLQGSRIITSWHDYPAAITGRTERPLLDWFTQNVRFEQTWLDVGAHYGYTAIALSRLVGPCGRVFAFEPMLSTAGCVARTRMVNRLRQLTVLPVALGSTVSLKPVVLETVRGMVDSSLGKIRAANQKPDGWREEFLSASLDWLWPQICGKKDQIDGIKVDVQGMEVEVLEGMRFLLNRWKPKLVVEVHSGVGRGQLLDLIEAAGYTRRGTPIEPLPEEREPGYHDDRSYAFMAQPQGSSLV